jgi:hypothetical protein
MPDFLGVGDVTWFLNGSTAQVAAPATAHAAVSGTSCSTGTEYNARVTCKRGSRRVVFTYQQNT